MDIIEAMNVRHSVRQYTEQPLSTDITDTLTNAINTCNAKSGLHIQLITNEPKAFDSFMAHYGKFSGVTNYLALVGKKGPSLEEKCGYYGEQLVLLAQQLGLNTCWVASTYKKIKSAYHIADGEKLCIVIALGYGKTQGHPHKSKSIDSVMKSEGEIPSWFRKGAEAALLAPTAINQQKFLFTCRGNQVSAKSGIGPCTKIDLGIAKYHFEIGAGDQPFEWV